MFVIDLKSKNYMFPRKLNRNNMCINMLETKSMKDAVIKCKDEVKKSIKNRSINPEIH